MERTLYDIFEVAATASAETIRAAYIRLIKRYHPDKVGPIGLRLTQDLNAAFDVLGDAERRAAYDEELRRGAASRARSGEGKPTRREIAPALIGAVAGHLAEAVLFKFLFLGRALIWLVASPYYAVLSTMLAVGLGALLGYLLWPFMLTCVRQCWPARAAPLATADLRLMVATCALLCIFRVMAFDDTFAAIATQLAFLGGLHAAGGASFRMKVTPNTAGARQ